MNNNKLLIYLTGAFLLWTVYEIYIFGQQIWLKHLMIGLVSLLIFIGFFGLITYLLKK